LALFAGAALLLRSALARRARVLEARAAGRAAPEPSASLATLGNALPPLVVMALAFVGAKTSLAFFAFGGSRVLSLFDLAGFLALLAAYGTSLVFATRYREPAVPAAAPARALAGEPAPAIPEEVREPAKAA
jgi:hypothetical protein